MDNERGPDGWLSYLLDIVPMKGIKVVLCSSCPLRKHRTLQSSIGHLSQRRWFNNWRVRLKGGGGGRSWDVEHELTPRSRTQIFLEARKVFHIQNREVEPC
jgi:hypothetical protein